MGSRTDADWLNEVHAAHSRGALDGLTAGELADSLGLSGNQGKIAKALIIGGPSTEATAVKNIHRDQWGRLCSAIGPDDETTPAPTVSEPEEPRSAAEILADRTRLQERDHRRLATLYTRTVEMPDARPFGVLIFGDPHLDDDGTDIQLVQRHVGLVRSTPGLYAACVGDVLNNWPHGGKLAKKWKDQRTTESEALTLADWFVSELAGRWVAFVGGNHDAWNGGSAASVLAQHGVPFALDELRARLVIPGCDPFIIHARHSFRGKSMYSRTHGGGRAALMDAPGADLYTAGHYHEAGIRQELTKDGIPYTVAQVGSYKRYDEYARRIGFKDGSVGGEAIMVIVHPERPRGTLGRTMVTADIEGGCKYLRALR